MTMRVNHMQLIGTFLLPLFSLSSRNHYICADLVRVLLSKTNILFAYFAQFLISRFSKARALSHQINDSLQVNKEVNLAFLEKRAKVFVNQLVNWQRRGVIDVQQR